MLPVKSLPLETAYVHDLMARATIVFPDVRLFRRNTGIIQLEARVFRAGISGQCDVYALGKGARHFEIECKRFGKLFPPQEAWRDWCRSWGIPWLLLEVAKGEVPPETIHRWIEELREFFR